MSELDCVSQRTVKLREEIVSCEHLIFKGNKQKVI